MTVTWNDYVYVNQESPKKKGRGLPLALSVRADWNQVKLTTANKPGRIVELP